jgi:hypothetical protein
MNSIEKITKVTKDMVADAFLVQSNRIKAAAKDMSERYYRRNNDGVNVTNDMHSILCPPSPNMPESLRGITSSDTYGIKYLSSGYSANEISVYGLSTKYQGREYYDLLDATPSQYLAGLKAITSLADTYERLAREYKVAVLEAVKKHIKVEMDSARELAAIVLGS